jgi:CheY-like chemotaxis protein
VQAQRCTADALNHASDSDVKSTEASNHTSVVGPERRMSTLSVTSEIASTTASSTSDSSKPDLDMQTLHILVVEDNKINQNVLVLQLRLLGCTVYTADNGLEALELLSRSNFNTSPTRDTGMPTPPIRLSVILMDLEMPVMDGLTCVRRIRQMEAEGKVTHVPIIAVTANARSDQTSGAMEAGMVSVFLLLFLQLLV